MPEPHPHQSGHATGHVVMAELLRIPLASVCDVCLPNYYKTVGIACRLCEGSASTLFVLPLVCLALLLILFCFRKSLYQRQVKIEDAMRVGKNARKVYLRARSVIEKARVTIRIILSFLQVFATLSILIPTQPIPYPNPQPNQTKPSPTKRKPDPARPSPAPAQPRPAQSSPAQASPARPRPAQPGPGQPNPAQPNPAQPSPAQPSLAQLSPA